MTASITGRGMSEAPALLKWIRSSHPGVSALAAATSTVDAFIGHALASVAAVP